MTPQEETTIGVTLGEMSAKLDERDRKLDAIHLSLKEDIGKVEKQTALHNGRMSKLERRQSELKGVGIAVLALTPFVLFALQKLTGG